MKPLTRLLRYGLAPATIDEMHGEYLDMATIQILDNTGTRCRVVGYMALHG